MSTGTKLKTVYDGCSDIRAAIKEKDSTKGSGAIGTLADDITALYPDSVITKIYQDGTTGEYGITQYESTANSINSTVLTTNVPEGATVKTIILPQTVTSIAANSFKSNTGLEYINLENITSIGIGAFQLSGLTMPLNLPNLTTIASFACVGCKFTQIILPAIVSTAGTSSNNSGSFSNITTLTYAEFGPNCTTIGQRTFQNCSALTTFVCRAETPPTLGANVFASTNSALKIYVPYSADQSIINAYKAASNWSAQSSKIYELNEDGTVPTA